MRAEFKFATIMKRSIHCVCQLVVILAILCAARSTGQAQTHETGVFNAKLTLPAQMVVVGTGPDYDKVVRKTLKNNDLINLALGRPLSTKVNPKTEVLAAAVSYESASNAPLSQLIVYDPTQNGQAGVRTVVATLQSLEWQNAYGPSLNTGFGVASGTILATTLGNPAENGFLASAFSGGGTGAGKHLYIVGDEKASPVASVFIQSHLKFVYTDTQGTHSFDGFVVNGTARLSGKPIGGW